MFPNTVVNYIWITVISHEEWSFEQKIRCLKYNALFLLILFLYYVNFLCLVNICFWYQYFILDSSSIFSFCLLMYTHLYFLLSYAPIPKKCMHFFSFYFYFKFFTFLSTSTAQSLVYVPVCVYICRDKIAITKTPNTDIGLNKKEAYFSTNL